MYSLSDIFLLRWGLPSVSVLCTFVALLVFLWRIFPLVKCHRRAADPLMPLEPETFEDCAVIVYSRDQAAQLESLLPAILSQDYPGNFEVIVVNEGESSSVSDTIADLSLRYPNIYLTTTPDGARNLSRKKLAITLGVKATRKPVVVLTTAGVEIHSDRWLRSMMQHFRPENEVEVVLGYAVAPPYDDDAFGARNRSFDFIADSTSWISPAINGHPWRGTEHNLAYRRSTFFANKGFSRTLNLRYGDDDIFISEIARKNNTMVELSDDSVVSIPGGLSPQSFREEKARRSFTSRFIPRRPRLLGGLGFTAYMIAPLPAVAGIVLNPTDTLEIVVCAGALIAWFAAGMVWNIAARILHGRRLTLSTPLLAFTRPMRKLRRGIRSLFKHGKRYTWE